MTTNAIFTARFFRKMMLQRMEQLTARRRSTSRISRARRASGSHAGFSLVEVIMAISIVSFAMLPVMGLLGVGMNAAQDSIKSSTSAHILQQVQTLVQNQDAPPFYFSSAGDKVATTGDAMYEVTIQPGTAVNDATKGLAAKKLSTIIIKRLGTASPVEYARTFTVTSQNPASLWQGQ